MPNRLIYFIRFVDIERRKNRGSVDERGESREFRLYLYFAYHLVERRGSFPFPFARNIDQTRVRRIFMMNSRKKLAGSFSFYCCWPHRAWRFNMNSQMFMDIGIDDVASMQISLVDLIYGHCAARSCTMNVPIRL